MAGGVLDSVTLEVIRCSLEYAAEEMGVRLRKAAYSPNIKERMDHSCAIFNEAGDTVAQAEHIPTHLGSMGWGVRATLKYLEAEGVELRGGDVVIVNNPYVAGTHLNDVLAISPVVVGGEVIAYVASKAHYVDVGGKVPGSMPGEAAEVHEEGLIIPPTKVVEEGVLREDILKLILANVRAPEVIVGDLKAQIYACEAGVRRVKELAGRYGVAGLKEAFNAIIAYVESLTEAALRKLPDFRVRGEDVLEDAGPGRDAVIRVEVVKEGGSVTADFSGSSPQVPAPLNAPVAVTIAATTYAIKSVVDPDLPVNAGFYRRVRVEAPPSSIVNASYPAPVAASIETAQRIVDTVYAALAKAVAGRVPAASCGSMNNLLLGGPKPGGGGTWAFYETIAGGYGGRPGKDGVDGVHCNMTNTMNTPIESIENELPLLVVRYELREGSGGAGRWRGGCGVVRAIKLLAERAKATVLGERVKHPPWGLAGGMPGAPARYYVVRAGGSVRMLRSKETVELRGGDVIVVETAGGGGYGNPRERDPESVVRDVLDGLITVEQAVRQYGVDLSRLKEVLRGGSAYGVRGAEARVADP